MQLHSVTRQFWIRLATGFPDNHVSLAGALDGAAICFSTGALTEVWLKLLTTEEKQEPATAASSVVDSDVTQSGLCYFYSVILSVFVIVGLRVTVMRRERVSGRSPF